MRSTGATQQTPLRSFYTPTRSAAGVKIPLKTDCWLAAPPLTEPDPALFAALRDGPVGSRRSTHLIRFLFFDVEVVPVTREVIRRAEPDRDRRPCSRKRAEDHSCRQ